MKNKKMILNDDLRRMWEKTTLDYLRYDSRIFLEWLRRTMKNLGHDV
jgi:hypothetical protein